MGKIHRLPPDLANQIAAGEVVERPASVIKELVENAVDAGATRVTITVEAGGKRLIRVDDDGEGMEPDDARLSVERHATSKIRHADDLGRISTLGFRGEALPSIASVSRFTMRSRTAAHTIGTEIQIEGGGPASASEAGCPVGTSIEVRDLFFNLPARRKFLKTDAAEMAQVTRIVTQLALCYANVGVTLANAGRKTIEYPPVASLRDRLFQIYGDRPDLVPVERSYGDVRVHGFVAALASEGPVRGPQHVFVNRRAVKDRTITHAILDAYSQASIKERSPEVHLLIEMPLEAVDVNVHPTKAEVRFRDQSFIHQVVRRAVADAVGAAEAPFFPSAPASSAEPLPTTAPLPTPYASTFPSRWLPQSGGGLSFAGSATEAREALYGPFPAGVASEATVEAAPVSAEKTLMPLGQFRDTFIVAVDDDGIAIIDQHVAHERILFERITERLTSGRLESQRLLEPLLVELSASGRQALLAHAADLDRLGFEIEDFGGESLRLSACPALLPRDEWQRAVRALAEDLDGLDRGATVTDALKRIAATMACHAAVKANYPLTPEKMAHILDGLRRTAYSTICPHGRPVMLRLTRRELEKRFERI
ncbi:MAG TPA: DNA mismatch repair endonuclease MutL [Vicinamibacterales bacterium]|jgi:DNA mismatch repair protein MutL|nr:DNA mismatch repair endonuclease MutL [Vicinamibacterales bacterium]